MASRSGTPQLRPHPRKRTAERRRDRRMQRVHLRGRTAGRRSRLELATMHPAALAPLLRLNAVALDTQWTQLRRLLVRQTLQKRRQFRMAELRVPYLHCHDDLCCSRPGRAAPAVRGSSETAPGTDPCCTAQTPIATLGRKTRATPESAEMHVSTKNGMHPMITELSVGN